MSSRAPERFRINAGNGPTALKLAVEGVEFDEIVTSLGGGALFHLERMSDKTWVMILSSKDGGLIHTSVWVDRGGRVHVNVQDAADLPAGLVLHATVPVVPVLPASVSKSKSKSKGHSKVKTVQHGRLGADEVAQVPVEGCKPTRRPYCKCGRLGVRNEKYDAYYCPVSRVWLEEGCGVGGHQAVPLTAYAAGIGSRPEEAQFDHDHRAHARACRGRYSASSASDSARCVCRRRIDPRGHRAARGRGDLVTRDAEAQAQHLMCSRCGCTHVDNLPNVEAEGVWITIDPCKCRRWFHRQCATEKAHETPYGTHLSGPDWIAASRGSHSCACDSYIPFTRNRSKDG